MDIEAHWRNVNEYDAPHIFLGRYGQDSATPPKPTLQELAASYAPEPMSAELLQALEKWTEHYFQAPTDVTVEILTNFPALTDRLQQRALELCIVAAMANRKIDYLYRILRSSLPEDDLLHAEIPSFCAWLTETVTPDAMAAIQEWVGDHEDLMVDL